MWFRHQTSPVISCLHLVWRHCSDSSLHNIYIGLSIVINKNVLVNGLGPIVELVNQGPAQSVNIRAPWAVRNANANAAELIVGLDVVGAKVQIILAVARDGGRGPHGLVRPCDVFIGEDSGMLCPVDQVWAREGIEVRLLFVRVGRSRIDPVFTSVELTVWISVPSVHEGVASLRRGVVVVSCHDQHGCCRGEKPWNSCECQHVGYNMCHRWIVAAAKGEDMKIG